jgi:hypothetical protein
MIRATAYIELQEQASPYGNNQVERIGMLLGNAPAKAV